jgi:hypothetical protein
MSYDEWKLRNDRDDGEPDTWFSWQCQRCGRMVGADQEQCPCGFEPSPDEPTEKGAEG